MGRLDKICSMIPMCGVVADIGCDHGKVSEFVAKNGLAKEKLIVNDISEQSLQKARERLNGYDDKRIMYICCDGSELLQSIDCAVIAGMGGREIVKILAAIRPACAVLSPQNHAFGMRQWLYENGYTVQVDTTLCDSGKFYDILKVELKVEFASEPIAPDACMLHYGYCYKQKNPDLLKRLHKDQKNLRSYKQTPENLEKLRIIEEVLTWQR